MSRLSRVLRTLVVAIIAAGVLWVYLPLALGSGMGAILSRNATEAKAKDDLETHAWSMEESVRWNPHHYHALYRLGFHHADKKEYDRAQEVLEACIESAPGHLGALLGLADIYTRDGDYEKARAMTERALHVAPTSWRAHLSAGMIESRAGDQKTALLHLEKADHFARSSQSDVFIQMGIIHLLEADADRALISANRALAMKRHDPGAMLVKGKALVLLGRFEESIDVLRTAARGSNDDATQRSDARLHLAGALIESGHFLEPSELVRDEVRESPAVPHVRATAERLLSRLNALLAESKLEVEVAGEVQCNLGYAYAAMGTLDPAATHFEAARLTGAELESSCVWAHAETLLRLERAEEAIERYETAIAMGTAPVQMRIGLTEALIRAGRIEDARMQYLVMTRGHTLTEDEQARVEALGEQLH